MQKWSCIIVLLSGIFLSSCNTNRSILTNTIAGNELKVDWNVNVETFALIYNLSDAGELLFSMNPEPRAMLARKVSEGFQNYKEHQAVQLLNELLDEGFVDLYDIDLSVYCSPLPELQQFAPFPSIYYEHDSLRPEEVQLRFDRFHDAVRDFYQDAQLHDFFEKEKERLYAKLMNEVNEVKPNEEYLSALQLFYGVNELDVSIIVSACSFNGIGRSKTITQPLGNRYIQLVTSDPNQESNKIDLSNLNTWQIGYTSADYFREIATHELNHSILSSSLRENIKLQEEINALSHLFTEDLKLKMKAQGYQDWSMCFEEHLVRAIELKVAEQIGDHEFVTTYSKNCIDERGFIYLTQFCALLDHYSKNRTTYLSLDQFLPYLVQELNSIIE